MIWIVASIVTAILTVSAAARTEGLVGKVVPPFPDGMYQGGGACIGAQASCDRGVGVLISAAGKKVGVYATRDAGRDERRGPLWAVTDVISYPEVPKGHELVWASCRCDKVEDASVIAVVKNSKQQYLAATGWAYRVDQRSGKLNKLDPKRVDCFNTALEAD
jgi:hypothetical protein